MAAAVSAAAACPPVRGLADDVQAQRCLVLLSEHALSAAVALARACPDLAGASSPCLAQVRLALDALGGCEAQQVRTGVWALRGLMRQLDWMAMGRLDGEPASRPPAA